MNRKYYVRLKTYNSDMRYIKPEALQGSILGHSFFYSLCINDLPRQYRELVDIINLYIDGNSLTVSSRRIDTIISNRLTQK